MEEKETEEYTEERNEAMTAEKYAVMNSAEAFADRHDIPEEKIIDFDAVMKRKRVTLFIKRAFDIAMSFFGLVILLPLFLIVAVVIKCDSKGPIFYRQPRVGRGGKEFRIYKFRTMRKDADKIGHITVSNDSRITKVGKALRKLKIDELPQLINVLKGEMSFVGYRPDVPDHIAEYTDYQRNLLRIKPGITGLASIEFRNMTELYDDAYNADEQYMAGVMQKKVAIDMEYIVKMGFFFDLWLIIKTFFLIFK